MQRDKDFCPNKKSQIHHKQSCTARNTKGSYSSTTEISGSAKEMKSTINGIKENKR